MASLLAVAVRTIALRDYTVMCNAQGRWIVRNIPGVKPVIALDAEDKGRAYNYLVCHICGNRREDIRALVAEMKAGGIDGNDTRE